MLPPSPKVEMLGVSTAQATAVSAVAASNSITMGIVPHLSTGIAEFLKGSRRLLNI